MKKIAIIRCLKTSASCAGAGCLRVFYEREKAFAQYGEEELRLMAMWTCNGCGTSKLENQEGLQRKMDKAKQQDLDMLYVAGCVFKKRSDGSKKLCSVIEKMAAELQTAGVNVVFGKD